MQKFGAPEAGALTVYPVCRKDLRFADGTVVCRQTVTRWVQDAQLQLPHVEWGGCNVQRRLGQFVLGNPWGSPCGGEVKGGLETGERLK